MSRERRRNFRLEWTSPATIELPSGEGPLTCTIVNLSNGGARLGGVKAAVLPDEFALRIAPGVSEARACRVSWRTQDEVGVQFIDTPAIAMVPARARKAVPVA